MRSPKAAEGWEGVSPGPGSSDSWDAGLSAAGDPRAWIPTGETLNPHYKGFLNAQTGY